MAWQKVDLSVLRHPRLRNFRSSARIRILEFVELSVRYGRPGVVDLYDDEIAQDLRMGLEDWLDLRDDMYLRKLIRVLPGDPSVYEVAFWLLPNQTAAPKGDFPGITDGRSREPWSEDSDLPDLSEMDAFAARSHRSGALTAAERQAVRRAKKAAMLAGERFDRNAFLEDYRARKAARPPSEGPPECHETRDCHAENVTNFCHDLDAENRDVTLAQQQNQSREILEETDNNTLPGEAVTKECHESCHEREVVVAFLSVTGIPVTESETVLISPHVAEKLVEEVWERDQCFEVFYDQARRLPLRNHDPERTWEGLYICSVRGTHLGKPIGKPWGGPAGYEKQLRDREKQEAARQTREAQKRERQAEAERERERVEAEEVLLEQIEAGMTEEERALVYAQAIAKLPEFDRKRVERAQRVGEKIFPAIVTMIETERRKILLERDIGQGRVFLIGGAIG